MKASEKLDNSNKKAKGGNSSNKKILVKVLELLQKLCDYLATSGRASKLKECFNINQPFHSCQAAGQCSHFRSKSHDRSASASHHANAGNQNLFSPGNTNNGHTQSRNNHGKDCSISFSSSSQSLKHQAFPQTPNSALFKDDANNILTLLCELQYEVANVRKRITALELANQRMSHIELHLAFFNDSGPTPMQEDPSKQLFYLSQFITPQGTHLLSWASYLINLTDKRGYVLFISGIWIFRNKPQTTIPNSNNQLIDKYLPPCTSFPPSTKNWIVTLDDSSSPLFGKQLSARATCFFASLLCSLILPMANEHIRYDTTEVVFPFTWADINEVVHSYYSHLDIIPDFSPMDISSMPFPNLQ
ncbi:hypothetical protein RhiirA5_428319 [Rhizophagus irregularis]|uniref:Uncharacterized protein n=1 Tax=Rhizophagus irregularis TaxID=588596 RepID=A0A2N0P0K5_9GLOM|nr:hypothetical protein RhiirA5_428319 [Rhizophagus irregularis]